MLGAILVPQRCPQPSPWNLGLCHLMRNKRLRRCVTLRILRWKIILDHLGDSVPSLGSCEKKAGGSASEEECGDRSSGAESLSGLQKREKARKRVSLQRTQLFQHLDVCSLRLVLDF